MIFRGWLWYLKFKICKTRSWSLYYTRSLTSRIKVICYLTVEDHSRDHRHIMWADPVEPIWSTWFTRLFMISLGPTSRKIKLEDSPRKMQKIKRLRHSNAWSRQHRPPSNIWQFSGRQWCWWYCNVGDLKLVTILDVDERIKIILIWCSESFQHNSSTTLS